MSRKNTFGLLSSLLLTLTACASNSSTTSPPTPTVTDTRGTQFSVSCSGSMCTLTVQDPAIAPMSCDSAYGTDTFVILWSRVLTIHVLNVPTSGGTPQVSAAEPGHPVKCAATSDCSAWDATLGSITYQFVCQNGICQDPSKVLTTNDVITLCQADLRWPSTCPYITSQPFADRLAEIGQVCDSSGQCASVPADCWQPTDLGQTTSTVDGGAGVVDSGASAQDSGV
jgi:hypothetical protein